MQAVDVNGHVDISYRSNRERGEYDHDRASRRRDLIENTQYLVLATSDEEGRWVAPVEPLADEDLNFYFFSTPNALRSRHIEAGGDVAAVMFATDQPEYTPGLTANLDAVQMKCSGRRLAPSEYNEAVRGAIVFLKGPMPPYEVYMLTPSRFYVPAIEDGVNTRYEVEMG